MFRMTESDPCGVGGWGEVGQATTQQCIAGQVWGICLVRVFSICLVGVGWEWGRGRGRIG